MGGGLNVPNDVNVPGRGKVIDAGTMLHPLCLLESQQCTLGSTVCTASEDADSSYPGDCPVGEGGNRPSMDVPRGTATCWQTRAVEIEQSFNPSKPSVQCDWRQAVFADTGQPPLPDFARRDIPVAADS